MESKRITGTEMEWAPMVPAKGDRLKQLEHHDLNPFIHASVTSHEIGFRGSAQHYFLANGSRLYADVGDHREYATPEDTSYEGTTANEIAGEQIITKALRLLEDKTDQKVTLVKRVICDDNVGSGYHISYSADARRMEISSDDLALFGVFAATRSVLFGAGALLKDGSYILSQKAHTVNSDYNGGTTQFKPVVNLRNEPLADNERFLRVHDTSSDPNMSPWSTRVKLAAGSLVLRLIEEDRRLEDFRFTDSLTYVTREVTKDVSLSERFKLIDGRSLTALEVQLALLTEARKLEDCNNEELWALDEWEKAVYDLQQNPRLAANRVEWVIRRQALERIHERQGLGWQSQDLRAKDRQFSEFVGDSMGLKLRESEKAWADYMPDQSLIDQRLQSPPKDTRAYMRSKFITFAHQYKLRNEELSWDRITLNGAHFKLKDPLSPEHDGLEAAMEEFQRNLDTMDKLSA